MQEHEKAELKRICDTISLRAGKRRHSNELSSAGATFRILTWLGKQTEKDPLFRCNSKDLFIHALATKGEIDAWDTGDSVVKKEFRDSTRRYVLDARDYIESYYKAEGVPYGVRVALPLRLNRTEPARVGAYGLRFIEASLPNEASFSAPLRKQSAAEIFWKKIVVLEGRAKALLVYPADPIRLRNRHMDDRGLWSGSGEVAGAFVLGGSMGELWKSFDVRRSCDVTANELRSAPCILLLGSSLKTQVLKELREELLEDSDWPTQAYVFKEIKGADGKVAGAVCNKDRAFLYTVESLRDHETDFALISYFRHTTAERSLIALQGISTVATRAAAEFLASDIGVQQIQRKLGVEAAKPLPSFEIVLEVVSRGYVPVKTRIQDVVVH